MRWNKLEGASSRLSQRQRMKGKQEMKKETINDGIDVGSDLSIPREYTDTASSACFLCATGAIYRHQQPGPSESS